MNFRIHDLEDLAQQVRNPNTKKYMQEALISYRAGAYRASIISTWIAVCVDIIEKIKELSLGGDNAAKAIETRLNGISDDDIPGMLSFEKELIDLAHSDLELISIIDKKHLERLKEDRNLCAHPTFSEDGSQFTPTPELTKAHIVEAAISLFTNIPVKGKVIINRLYQLIEGDSFPQDDEQAFKVLSADTYLGRVKQSSVRNLTVILLKRLFCDKDSLSPEHLNRICAALGAIERKYHEIYKDIIITKLNLFLADAEDKILKRIFPFLIKRTEIWQYIEDATVIRLKNLIVTLNIKKLAFYNTPQLADLIPDINKAVQEKIESLEPSEIKELVESALPAKNLKRRAIDIFTESGSFASAYSNGINILVPYSKFFNQTDLKELFKGIHEKQTWTVNQILDAGGIDEVFLKVYTETKDTVDDHGVLWLNFWGSVDEYHRFYGTLEEALIEDKLIDSSKDSQKEQESDEEKL